MRSITVDIWLYGGLSCYGKVIHQEGDYSTIHVQLVAGSKLKDLMDYLLMCTNERGYTFINKKMSATPNDQQDLDHVLQDGDRVFFFPLKLAPAELQLDGQMPDEMDRILRSLPVEARLIP